MNLKRTLSAACASAVLLASVPAYAKTMEFTIGSTTLYISDSTVEAKQIETAPYIENDRTMVPVRIISENFGAIVQWVEETRQVIIKNGGTEITLTLGSNEAIVNGEVKLLDAAPAEVGGRTMVPLRFISENLGKTVSYVEATEQVLISDEKPIMTVNGADYTLDDYRFFALTGELTEDYSMADHVSEITELLKEIGIFASSARNEGNAHLTQEENKEIKNYVNEASDAIYPDYLMAPIARFYADKELAVKFMEEKSSVQLSDETIAQVYETEYVRAKHILILTQDSVTGMPYTDEEKAKAKELIEDILSRINAGEDFDKLCDEYCEDPGVKTYPDGYVFTRGEMVEEFETTAFELEPGEISDIVETSYGYHIIRREALPELDESTAYVIKNYISQAAIQQVYDEYFANADVQMHMTNEEIAALFSE